ncbi:MAG: AAA family ATPase [Desulfovibrio sp.]|jgi:putative DNA primase/helicase|nr:AAA family ATPase [Desulfovibrio sp.]
MYQKTKISTKWLTESRKLRAEEDARRHAEAAAKAQRIYAAAADCIEHPYLSAKGVGAVPGLKIANDGRLIVPLLDDAGSIKTLQFIDDAGAKRFLTGGKKLGCFFAIGGKEKEKPLLIAEGLSTALSLHECLDLPVLVGGDAGNLLPVAEMARLKYPGREIILCADNDVKAGEKNTGVEAASDAALAVDGFLAIPRHEGRRLDFNDLHRLMGADEVRNQVSAYSKPEAVKVPENKAERPPLRVVNIADFLRMEFSPREMLLEPILPRQGIMMLHAFRGAGKTYAALSLAYAVASGGVALCRWQCPDPARVLFIDGEMPAQTIKDRLGRLIIGSEKEPPSDEYLRILTGDLQPDGIMPNLATEAGQEALEPFLADVDLVVLDNLSTLARHGRSNDEESWLPVQGGYWVCGGGACPRS